MARDDKIIALNKYFQGLYNIISSDNKDEIISRYYQFTTEFNDIADQYLSSIEIQILSNIEYLIHQYVDKDNVDSLDMVKNNIRTISYEYNLGIEF